VPATRPPPDTPAPHGVIEAFGHSNLEPLWRNELGGLTFGDPSRVVKWNPHGNGIDLGAEAARMAWARPYLTVPEVLGHGSDGDGSWLIMERLRGDNAVSPAWQARPDVASRALGIGLRLLHDRLPVDRCPFSWHVEDRLAATADAADPKLGPPPPIDRLVVCHGDACAPNTLLDPIGRPVGHVDVGALGVADRWADLAVITWSTVWNYGPGWESTVLEAYGADPDPARTEFYRALWDRSGLT